MSLADYARKRDFRRTGEPAAGQAAGEGRALFVVQLHHARRRHYDFRLQVGDALRSWAVPKGPSYDPAVKRLAVQVEDHPLDYAGFEGRIPEGQYGGGHVAVFDRGVWTCEGDPAAQLAKGHLRFELFGQRLRGGWHLVRSGRSGRQPQWLLFKDSDGWASALEADDLLAGVLPAPAADRRRAGAGKPGKKGLAAPPAPAGNRAGRWRRQALALPGARPGELPAGPVPPQLAVAAARVPDGPGWVHEIKWDGYRLLATVGADGVRLWSRNGLDWSDRAPEVVAALAGLGLRQAVLDGELVAGRGTRADFTRLQAILAGRQPGRLACVLFDLLHLDGIDLAAVPLHGRKALLARVLEGAPEALAFSSHVEGDGQAAFDLAVAEGFEGVVAKRADAPWQPGRSDRWRKVKTHLSDEFAVVGMTAPRGSRQGLGALLLARPDPVEGWRYAGRVGTGFSDVQLRQLAARLGRRGGTRPTVTVAVPDPGLRGARWFPPALVVEVAYRGIGGNGLLRQASFKTLREDKRPADLEPLPALAGGQEDTPVKTPTRATRATTAAPAVALSSPDKTIYPRPKRTKQQVRDYYVAVMDQLLPGIAGRPLSVLRCPDGIGGTCFVQKHPAAGIANAASRRVRGKDGDRADYLVVQSADDVLALVQGNALEFHPWGSHADAPGLADRLVFDLDPGPGVEFAGVRRAALELRRLLRQAGLESFARVTGGKGVHVVVPLNPPCRWPQVKRFARGFARALEQAHPQRYVATASKARRQGRIYVDYLRNDHGATAVASYSLRARPGAAVAMPVSWNALARLQRADGFGIDEVPALLRRRRRDPWAGIDAVVQDLSAWAADAEDEG